MLAALCTGAVLRGAALYLSNIDESDKCDRV
jgi:hypothetical protein